MKATGIVRRIDDLGKIVILKEIRRTMHIREGSFCCLSEKLYHFGAPVSACSEAGAALARITGSHPAVDRHVQAICILSIPCL